MDWQGGHKVEISSTVEHGTIVLLDGVPIKGVVNIEYRHHVKEMSRIKLTLEVLPSELHLSGDVGIAAAVCAEE